MSQKFSLSQQLEEVDRELRRCYTSQTQDVLPCREPDWESGERGSIWDMAVNFFWSHVNWIMSEISISLQVSRHNADLVEKYGSSDPRIRNDQKLASAMAQSEETVRRIQEAAEKCFAQLKCEHVNRAAKALGQWKRSSPDWADWADLFARSCALRNAIETELREYFYYQYPKDKGNKLKAWKQDWKRTVEAFPNTQRDIFSATDCYALGHSTGSVFHSMRVAEHGLRALAKERKIRLPKNKEIEWATWQEIIKALDDEIKLIGTTKKAGAAKDAALEFYSGARADLNGFKDEYRNQVSHVRATYDDLQALRALTNVNAFMERVSAKIDHNHHRIRWGLR